MGSFLSKDTAPPPPSLYWMTEATPPAKRQRRACLLFAVKAGLKPSRTDSATLPKVATLGFFGFLFGILSMAQFSPGEAGDVAALGVGFWGQTMGLMLMLGGVIVQFDAGNKNNISPQMRFQMFSGGTQVSPA